MHYWLLKTEPETFGIDDLKDRPNRTEHWDGVRNYQARNLLRDGLKKGDLAFFYHSSCAQPGIVGIVEVVRAGYPDFTAFNPESDHFDPKSTPETPRWYMVDVRFKRASKRTITLTELKQHRQLHGMTLLARGNRLSVMPVTAAQWDFILSLV
jgi:predicted RNA-binding protein with PUA-like domain